MPRAFDNLSNSPGDNFATWIDGFDGHNGLRASDGATEETMAQQISTFVEMLQTSLPGPRGYRLRRIILTNFWLYGQQEFEIPHGRLFLAGENASGKSTVLSAALPIALDGDLRPNRLDTFGGRERRMEYYVLGGTESATPFSFERRTAYIALEFEWCDPDAPPIAEELRQRWENGEREKSRFLTIGLSIAGNANATDRIRPLRFIITDGSRLGYDIHTVYESGSKHDTRAYDHSRFKQVLEGHGFVCDSQAEYERQVARYLFGFEDAKDFHKLINLLLVLRRPNLSSELNFSRVHDYLKQSLPRISSETTQRVIGTIERIDAIQSEIARIQESYKSTEQLHRARQRLALVRAQLAACEYTSAQQGEDTVAARVAKLRKELLAAEGERNKAEERSQHLQRELSQVNGQIKALEASEGLQVAQRLASVQERAQESTAQMHLQEQNWTVARRSVEESVANLERQRSRFAKVKAESATHLQELCHIAAEESVWEVAAFQLQEALQQVNVHSTESASAPAIPGIVMALLGEESEERIGWLRHLEELHKQREQVEGKVQFARSLETTRFQELDEARRRFRAIQDFIYESQQNLSKALDPFFPIVEDGSAFSQIESMAAIGQEEMQDDESLTGAFVEQVATALDTYRQAIETLEHELAEAAEQVQGKLNELQLLTGSVQHEMAELQALYEEKRFQPEFTPEHPARRTLARARLAEQGIAALPLYALLDFAPEIDSESDEAGRIEAMLEDAGLLDALVVAPSQAAAADVLLATEDLSDCRLDVEGIAARLMDVVAGRSGEASESGRQVVNLRGLRFDVAANEYEYENDSDNGPNDSGPLHLTGQNVVTPLVGVRPLSIDWEKTTAVILNALTQSAEMHLEVPFTLDEQGVWRHGLLRGQAGGGVARCIGRATRLRVKERELAVLEEKLSQLDERLKALTGQLAQYELDQVQLHEKQVQLRKMLANSGVERLYTELVQVKQVLDDVRRKYQKARQQTQEARQQSNAITAQLERDSQGHVALASNSRQVQSALMGMVKLKNQARSLQLQLTTLANGWEEYQQTREMLQEGKINEQNVAALFERVRNQALQAQAEVDELQRSVMFANAQELSERLRSLREQHEMLSGDLEGVKTNFGRADERVNNTTTNLAEAETLLQEAQQVRGEKQIQFVDLLSAYPVETLLEEQEAVASGNILNAARRVMAKGQPSEEIAGGTRLEHLEYLKDHLENEYREAYSFLTRTFNHEQPRLHEYGPDLDDQGNVLFLHEHKSRPVELLALLSERIEMQQTLLGQEERQLFEDFLLQEIAEAIRTHILEAEEWVQQINGVLSGLPLIGEHYALQWKPPSEYDMTKLGSNLAQHYRLLRKPAQALTAEEAETLMGAFRQEIASVRLRQIETPDMSFVDALEQVFDYREWFHFDVWVTPIGGQRQRMTDRVAGTRSGAEQLFALYVPLFAALGALYRSAAPGAPRLLALDEAFDKVSVANTQRIIEFLVSQDFQWIMTGPQVSGTGAKIPACARYLMIHEKGSLEATASASFWSDTNQE